MGDRAGPVRARPSAPSAGGGAAGRVGQPGARARPGARAASAGAAAAGAVGPPGAALGGAGAGRAGDAAGLVHRPTAPDVGRAAVTPAPAPPYAGPLASSLGPPGTPNPARPGEVHALVSGVPSPRPASRG